MNIPGRIFWTENKDQPPLESECPQNGRLRDAMGGILGYARVSTGDQDVAGQTLRLTQAGALKVFSNIRFRQNDGAARP
jgi:hypothetical protein